MTTQSFGRPGLRPRLYFMLTLVTGLVIALIGAPSVSAAARRTGTLPPAPAYLWGEAAGVGAIWATWYDDDYPDTTAYSLYQTTPAGVVSLRTVPAAQTDAGAGGQREYVLTGLDPNHYYDLGVSTTNADGTGPIAWVDNAILARPLSGNLSYNPGFGNLKYWSSLNGTLSRVQVQLPGTSYAAKVTRKAGNFYNLSDSAVAGMPPTILGAKAGTSYLASAWVRAASSNTVGKPVYAALRERNAGLVVMKDSRGAARTLTNTWQKVWVQAQVAVSGDTVGVRFEQTSAVPGNAFSVADVQVQKIATPEQIGSPATAGPLTPNVKRVTPVYESVCSDNDPYSSDPCSQTYQITQIRAWVDGKAGGKGSQPLRAVVYAEGVNYAPTKLLASSNTVTIVAGRPAGWVTFTLTQPLEIQAAFIEYSFGLQAGGTATVVRYFGDQSTNSAYGGNFTYQYGAYNVDSFSNGPAAVFGTPTPTKNTTFIELRGGGWGW